MAGQKTFTYSFLDVQSQLAGPGGNISLGNGAGIAEDGITIEYTEDIDNMLIGAGGEVAHSLRASRAGKMTFRILKTSPVNQSLAQMCNFQRSSSLNHGQNVLTLTNTITGDIYTGRQAAFARFPSNVYGKDAGTVEWEFNCGRIDVVLGGAGLLVT